MSDDETVIVGTLSLYHKSDCHHLKRAGNPKDYAALESASFRATLDGRSPCRWCNPPHDPDWDNLARHLGVIRRVEDIDLDVLASRLAVVSRLEDIDVAVMRREAVTMLDRIFGPDVERKALKARVLDLHRRDRIPTDVANCLHMISDLRNMAEHSSELTDLQGMIAKLCWTLVKEWSGAGT